MADADDESGDSKPPVNQGNFLATAIEHQEEVSGLVKSIADAVVDALVRVAETQNKHERKLAYVVATVLLVIIGTGAGLTWVGKLDAVAFAFLVGPIVGGLITYLVQSLAPVSMFDVG